MRRILLLLFALFLGLTTFSQDCYNSTRSRGISLYNQGKLAEAKKLFEAADDCPDKPADNDLASWIKKCKGGPKGQLDKVSVETIDFSDANGVVPNACYSDDIGTRYTKVVFDNQAKTNNKLSFELVLIDPDGEVLVKENTKGVTESKDVTLKPGVNTVFFSELKSYSNTYAVGVYTVEIWSGKTKLKDAEIEVYKRPSYLLVNGNRNSFDHNVVCNTTVETFQVKTNAKSFYIKHKPSWVTVNESEQTATSFSITVEENRSYEPRSGSFDVYTDDEEAWIVINLIQAGDLKYANQFGDRMLKDMKMKVGLEAGLSFFKSRASSGVLSSVIDYGVTDVPSMADLEEPKYKPLGAFGLSFLVDLPMTNEVFLETGITFQHFGVKNTFSNDRLIYTLGSNSYHMNYGCTEKYRMNYLNIPILAGYKVKLNSVSSVRFTGGFIIGLGLSAKCQLEEGYSNYRYTDNSGTTYIGNSTFSGSINLYSGKYSIEQLYSTGQSPTYTYQGYKSAPFKRTNIGFNLGAAYDFGSFELGLSATLGLSNIGRVAYFDSVDRVGGCLLWGEPVSSSQYIYGYKHHIHNIKVVFNYWL